MCLLADSSGAKNVTRAEIPVDLSNPGQVFACIGFVEAAEKLIGGAVGGFDWQSSRGVMFQLEAATDTNPIERVLRFLSEARVTSIAAYNSKISVENWGIETEKDKSGDFPFPHPDKPEKLPACLVDCKGNRLVIDHWGDTTRRRDNVKFWTGPGGYPGSALARDALELVRKQAFNSFDDPFSLAAEQSSSFRFDWRRDYIPIDAGFSPNKHKNNIVMLGYPLVELMAAIGLTNARPKCRGKLEYSYGVVGTLDGHLYDPIFLRAALGAGEAPFAGLPFRSFTMKLGWPGQKHKARCILNVFEDNFHDQI